MASTYSTRLKLELMEAGANAGVWGNNTNEPNFLKQIVDSPMCLGKNKDGSPSHPLYLPSNSKLLKFR